MSQLHHVDNAPSVIVVGAGPVGCLAAIALAKLRWNVVIYEARPGTMFISVPVTY